MGSTTQTEQITNCCLLQSKNTLELVGVVATPRVRVCTGVSLAENTFSSLETDRMAKQEEESDFVKKSIWLDHLKWALIFKRRNFTDSTYSILLLWSSKGCKLHLQDKVTVLLALKLSKLECDQVLIVRSFQTFRVEGHNIKTALCYAGVHSVEIYLIQVIIFFKSLISIKLQILKFMGFAMI